MTDRIIDREFFSRDSGHVASLLGFALRPGVTRCPAETGSHAIRQRFTAGASKRRAGTGRFVPVQLNVFILECNCWLGKLFSIFRHQSWPPGGAWSCGVPGSGC